VRKSLLVLCLVLCLPTTAMTQDLETVQCWSGAELLDDGELEFGPYRVLSVVGDSLVFEGFLTPAAQVDRMLYIPVEVASCDASEPIGITSTLTHTVMSPIIGGGDSDLAMGLSDGAQVSFGLVADNNDGQVVIRNHEFDDDWAPISDIVGWDAVVIVGGWPGLGGAVEIDMDWWVTADQTDLVMGYYGTDVGVTHPAYTAGDVLWVELIGTDSFEQYQIDEMCVALTCTLADDDGDGVPNDQDLCPDSAASDGDAGVPSKSLKKNRWADVDGDGVFEAGKAANDPYTIEETGGCLCSDIIDAVGLGKGHRKYGCAGGEMDDWVDYVATQ
jgi:hypothetical protein